MRTKDDVATTVYLTYTTITTPATTTTYVIPIRSILMVSYRPQRSCVIVYSVTTFLHNTHHLMSLQKPL